MADASSRDGGDYRTPAVLEYVDRLHHADSGPMRGALAAIVGGGLPSIQVGPGDGAAMAVLLAAAGARRVVEIGTLSGYSALWLLRALPADGRLWTLEASPAHAAAARRVLAGDDRVEVVEGPALETLPAVATHGPFDAVFVDADKTAYPEYVEWALGNLRPGGLVLADNAYLFGFLAGRAPAPRAGAAEIAAMRRCHQLVAAHCPLRCCLPTPDGLLVGVTPAAG